MLWLILITFTGVQQKQETAHLCLNKFHSRRWFMSRVQSIKLSITAKSEPIIFHYLLLREMFAHNGLAAKARKARCTTMCNYWLFLCTRRNSCLWRHSLGIFFRRCHAEFRVHRKYADRDLIAIGKLRLLVGASELKTAPIACRIEQSNMRQINQLIITAIVLPFFPFHRDRQCRQHEKRSK